MRRETQECGRVRRRRALPSCGACRIVRSAISDCAAGGLVYEWFVRGTRGALDRRLPVRRPRASLCAPAGRPSASARFLDRVLGRDRLRGPLDHGAAIRAHRPVSLHHPTLGRGRHLLFSPPTHLGRAGAGHRPSRDPHLGEARADRRAQRVRRRLADQIRELLDLRARRADGALIREEAHRPLV